MQGLILAESGLFITKKLLSTGNDLIVEAQSLLLEEQTKNYGILLERQAGGGYSTQGLAHTISGLTLTVNAFNALVKDSDGLVKPIKVATNQTIDFTGYPDGAYKILVQVKKNYYEDGTITLTNGSKNVTGAGTQFTKRAGGNLALVITDSGSGNDGVYPIESVTNDGALVLKNTFTGTTEATLPFSIGGYFPDVNFQPATTEDHRVYEMNSYEFVLTTGAPTSSQLTIATVTKTGGALSSLADTRVPYRYQGRVVTASDIESGTIEAGRLPATVVQTTGAQTITGAKLFTAKPTVSVAGTSGDRIEHLLLVGDQVNPFIRIAESASSYSWDIGLDGLNLYFATSDLSLQTDLITFTPTEVLMIPTLVLGDSENNNGLIHLLNDNNTYKAIITASGINTSDKTITIPNITGTIVLHNGVQAVSLGNTDITGTLEVSSNAQIDGNLNVAGNVTFGGFPTISVLNVGSTLNLGDVASTGLLTFGQSGTSGVTVMLRNDNANTRFLTLPALTGVLIARNTGDESVYMGDTGFIEVNEITAPSVPSANKARIFAEDNGSGKTRLMVRFQSGANQQIAIEP